MGSGSRRGDNINLHHYWAYFQTYYPFLIKNIAVTTYTTLAPYRTVKNVTIFCCLLSLDHTIKYYENFNNRYYFINLMIIIKELSFLTNLSSIQNRDFRAIIFLLEFKFCTFLLVTQTLKHETTQGYLQIS